MENEKKNCGCKRRKWLIPVIAVVVLLAAGLAVYLLGGFGQEKLYWNVDRMHYSSEDREPDSNGVYKIRVVCNGEVLEVPVKNPRLVSAIDSRNVMHLELDGDGYVTAVSDPENLTAVARKLYIKHTDGNTVYANGSMALNGMDYTLTLTDKTQIYDVMMGSPSLGEKRTIDSLNFSDGLVAYTNENGQVSHVFLTAHSGSSNIYWRTTRMYNNGAKQTIRVPDSEGAYSIEFACNGSLTTLKCKDIALVNQIDKAGDADAAFCFFFDKEGYISDVRDIRVGAHGVRVCNGYVVRSVEGKTFTAANPESTMVTFTASLPDECGIYDVSPAAIREGAIGRKVESLQEGDRIYLWADADGTPLNVYIQRRKVDVPVFRLYPTTFYDSGSKQTTRTANAEGWYLIELIRAGETGTKIYRTKDKALVNFLDSQTSTKLVGLELDGDVITQVYASSSVYGAGVYCKGYVVDQVVGCMMNVRRSGRGAAIALMMTPDCKVYDISPFGKLGEETQLRPGDVVESQANLFGQIEAVFVTSRR